MLAVLTLWNAVLLTAQEPARCWRPPSYREDMIQYPLTPVMCCLIYSASACSASIASCAMKGAGRTSGSSFSAPLRNRVTDLAPGETAHFLLAQYLFNQEIENKPEADRHKQAGAGGAFGAGGVAALVERRFNQRRQSDHGQDECGHNKSHQHPAQGQGSGRQVGGQGFAFSGFHLRHHAPQ